MQGKPDGSNPARFFVARRFDPHSAFFIFSAGMKSASKSPKKITDTVVEYVRSSEAKIDKDAGVIRGVKLLSIGKSLNGYSYSKEAVEAAANLYENLASNLDHGSKPGTERSIRDRFGRIVNVVAKPDGLYGDLEYLKSHPAAGQVVEMAERMSGILGMSHEAKVGWRDKSKTVVESILAVKSCDLVCSPASTKNLFEHQVNTVTIKTVRESATGKARKFLDWLCEEEMGMGDMPMEAPAADMDADGQLVAGFKAAVMAVIDDASLDLAGKKSKIGELLKMLDRVQNGGEKPAEEKPAEDAPAEESKKDKAVNTDPTVTTLQEEIKTLRRENMLHRVCQAEGYTPTPVMLKVLSRCDDEAEMKSVIQESRKAAAEEKPAPKVKSGLQTSGTVTESFKVPADQSEFNRLCFNRN